jgi:hypothetical protein
VNLSEQIARGVKAKALLADPLLSEAFSLAEKAILDKFRSAADDGQVVRSKQLLTALTLVRRVLEQAVSEGKIAAGTLEEERRGISFLGDVREAWRKRNQR